MGGDYTVSTEPAKGREYTNKHGTALTVWRFGLAEARSGAPDGLFELHRVKPPPKAGEKLAVERTQKGEFNDVPFTRLFLADTYQGGSGSGGGGSDNYDRRPEHPRNEARMIHTSAVSAAPDYYRLFREENLLAKPDSLDEAKSALRDIVGELERGYLVALAGLAGPASAPQVAAEVPADTEGLQPAAAGVKSDDDIPF